MLALLCQYMEVRDNVLHLLRSELFTGNNRPIFDAINQCHNGLTLVILRAQLDSNNISPVKYGGDQVLSMLFTMESGEWSPTILRNYVRILQTQELERRLRLIPSIIEQAELSLEQRTARIEQLIKAQDWTESDTSLMAHTEELFNPPASVIKTHVSAIDKEIVHLEAGEVVVLAGAASIGKTALVLNIIRNNINRGIPAAIFSLEMKGKLFMSRLACAELRINGKAMRSGKVSDEQKAEIYALAKKWERFLVIDDVSRTLSDIVRKIRRLNKQGIGLFAIDYLQLVVPPPSRGNREQDLSTITRTLKDLANELNIVIIELSQLSREHQKRDNQRPKLADLRESGAIEQDADFVWFIYYPEYYKQEGTMPGELEVELVIGKGRQTGRATPKFKFLMWCGAIPDEQDIIEQKQLVLANEPEWPSTDIDDAVPVQPSANFNALELPLTDDDLPF